MIEEREQASTDFAIGSNPDSGTMSAERIGDGRDDSDLSRSIVEGIAASSFANNMGRQFAQGFPGRECLDDFIQSHYHFRAPDAILFKRHELNKTNNNAFFA